MSMVENIKVSIIIPVYNGERHLVNTIESILSSTYRNIEIILVDDGSKDKSKEICDDYVNKDNRVKAFYKKNGGIVETRNWGMEKASGEYICFCDQDDIVSKDMYYNMIRRIEANDSEICICSTGRILDKQEIAYEKLEDAVYREDEILNNLLYPILFNGYDVSYKNKKAIIYGTIWKFMISKKLIMQNNLLFKRFINYEDDLIMSIELLALANNVSTISDVLYFWRINQESESSKNRYIENLENKINQLDEYIISVLNRRKVDSQVIEKYQEIKECNNYLQIIENENNTKKKMKEKTQILFKYIRNTNNQRNLMNLKLIPKGYIRSKVLLQLLMNKKIQLAIVMDQVLRLVNKFVSKMGWLIRIERRLKGI